LTYLASYATAPSVLLSEVVPSLLVPIKELTRSSSNESLLPKAISEALGISLAEVMDLYFRDGSDEEVQDHGRNRQEENECGGWGVVGSRVSEGQGGG
jgi:hypothetical protein